MSRFQTANGGPSGSQDGKFSTPRKNPIQSSLLDDRDDRASSGYPYSQSGDAESQVTRVSIPALLAPRPSPETDYIDEIGYLAVNEHGPSCPSFLGSTFLNKQNAGNNKAGKLQTLLPRPQPSISLKANSSTQSLIGSTGLPIPRRTATIVACENCRAKRTKCDGFRPKCGRCVRLKSICEYDAGPDETREGARKRKYEEMKSELDDSRELCEFFRSRPFVEIAELIGRMRTATNPHQILRLIRDGDLPLQASAIGSRGADTKSVVQKIDDNALRHSSIKVPARPWTDLVGDGLVSELVSTFFKIEQPFIARYIDTRSFLHDMRSSTPEKSIFCSPLLVNTICAYSAFTSASAKAIDDLGVCSSSIRDEFYSEAKRQLDLECGRVSLPTVMALYTLFLCSSAAGMDRAGARFRLSACEMYRRMRLGTKTPKLKGNTDPVEQDRYQKAVNRAAWGLFCLESISAYMYIEPPRISVPKLQRVFDSNLESLSLEIHANQDVFLDAECSLSCLFYDITSYNKASPERLGTAKDVAGRMTLYDRLLSWKPPPLDRTDHGQLGLGQSLFLRAYLAVVAVGLFRPLVPSNAILPGGLGSPRTLCVRYCSDIISHLRNYEIAYSLEYCGGSVATLYLCYFCSISLVILLGKEPDSHPPFVEACRHFHVVSKKFPVGSVLLTGLRALALELNVQLPEESLPYFAEASIAGQNLRDVPISYVIPQHSNMASLLAGDDDLDEDEVGPELGRIIEKWSRKLQ